MPVVIVLSDHSRVELESMDSIVMRDHKLGIKETPVRNLLEGHDSVIHNGRPVRVVRIEEVN